MILNVYYTGLTRMILFNHIFFSSLPMSYKNALTSHPSFLSLIDHTNYNPRLIEFLTDSKTLTGIGENDYFHYFRSNLDNPSRVWDHAFSQLSHNGQDLVISMFSLPSSPSLEDLEQVFSAFHALKCTKQNLSIGYRDFQYALREVEGTFTKSEEFIGDLNLAYHNPSVADFVENHIGDFNSVLLDIVESSISTMQLEKIWNYRSRDGKAHSFRPILLRSPIVLARAIDRILCRIDQGSPPSKPSILSRESSSRSRLLRILVDMLNSSPLPDLEMKFSQIYEAFLNDIESSEATKEEAVQTAKVLASSNVLTTELRQSMLKSVKSYVLSKTVDWRDFESICEYNDAFPRNIRTNSLNRVRRDFSECARLFSEQNLGTSPHSLRDNAERLRQIGESLEVDIAEYADTMDEWAERIELEREKRAEPDEIFAQRSKGNIDFINDQQVLSMFAYFRDSNL